ncbi:small nucleolar ribonucleoprotein complex subunit [Colletotrichum truncatum]|uniref:Small nucleolar ribonucleoprotein complex subunit n=1 Tax=Colletotrichum truncatum TaxID=5467 RepID=A0ACC3ZFH4_COLTU|nr:small nucleolar ribonucleoprotein complex subunit [Colletotrichum truncatum]KAF6801563.1 small nucleolar ribonucleoprotein complex subunit [Colletotrichum truncatum]
MAAPVGPLPQVKLPSGPSPVTAEQRYWKSFKNQLQIPSPTSYPITHISSTSSDGLFAVTTGTRVQLYSSRTRKLEKTITRFADVARSGSLRRDGRVLVAAEDTGRIQVFDTKSRSILKTWTTHRQPVWTTRFSDVQLTTLLSASDDKTVRLWDLTANDPTHTFVGHQDYVRCAEFFPATGSNGSMLVSGSYDSTVKIWDPRIGNNSAVMTFKHAAPVEAVLPLSSGTTLLAASGPHISVLDLVAARPVHQIANHQKTVTSLSLASNGTRLVSGGLDGHVKVFETTAWNVVSSTKYPSPILSLRVLSASDSLDHADRHLVVGMQSGVLSVRTRLTGPEATRQKEREREMAALIAGTLDQHDARTKNKKRKAAAHRRLEAMGEGQAEVIVAQDARVSRTKENAWQKALRHGRYASALDQVLDPQAKEHSPLAVLTLLLALRHRSAVRDALEGRNERTVQPVLKWTCNHIIDPRYVSVCVEVGLLLVELYAEYAGASAELFEGFRMLRRRVGNEVEKAQLACETGGMVESLMMGSV